MKKLTIIVLIAVTFLIFQSGRVSAFKLLDDKIWVKGSFQHTMNIRAHEDELRDVAVSSLRSNLRLEAMYDAYETADFDINFYILGNYFYDFGLDVDSDQRHAIRNEAGKSKYRNFRRPRDHEEWLTELYLDVTYRNFSARIGKQIVSWGETAASRVADLINPLDLKYMIAFPEWEDFKIGLWMARLFYTPENWWQDLSFEMVIIPFDFEENRLPPAGSGLFFGTPAVPNRGLQKMFDRMRRQAPSDGLNNFEGGIRIRGYANIGEGVDWMLSYFYTRLDSPLIAGREAFTQITRMILGLRAYGKMYTYPHYNSTAFSFATTWDKIGSSIRGECTYNSKVDYQYGSSSATAYGIKEKELVTTSIKISRNQMIPFISDRLFLNRSRAVSLSLTIYNYWMLNHEYNKHTGEYIIGDTGKDSSKTQFSFGASTGFWNDTILSINNFFYDTNGNSTLMTVLAFMPGDHWQWSVTYQKFLEGNRFQDQVILSARYDFQ